MIRITDIIDKIIEFNPAADIDVVERAYVYSAKVHDGQKRLSGEPYLSHPMEVAGILVDLNLDMESVAAGLLHDVIEDTHSTEDEICEIFGEGICQIVTGVTKISKIGQKNLKVREAESLRKMILAMAKDIRVIMIKIADRLHNMRTLEFHKHEEKKKNIAQETFDIYVPIASRLGMYKIKKELEDISFKNIQPDQYIYIKNLINKDLSEREKFVETVKNEIKSKLKEANLKGEVIGRYKHLFSIYNKMILQNLAFEDIYDIIAFRIILNTEAQCYEALGLIHSLWRPIAKKFKDYIGIPKPNMYQSLHTTVVGPFGERIEIQIRTHEMDKIAKSGIAAHWSYKEGKSFDSKTKETFAWLQNIVENQENFKNPDEFLENVRIDLYPDEVYVFTPQGDIITLPKDATPIDFAYMIHSEVGNQCTGSKVNGRMAPLTYKLRTGDTVEVSTTKDHHPSKDWLAFVKTVKARSRIRSWIKKQEQERSFSLGRELCEKAFRKENLNFNIILKSNEIDKAVEAFGLPTVDELIANVGFGKITPRQIINKIVPREDNKDKKESILIKIIGRSRKKKAGDGILVKGIDDILVRFGNCCQPLPGDRIVGFITHGQGVTVHRTNCRHVDEMNPERQIEVQWETNANELYPVKIVIQSRDRKGLLADITSRISKSGINIDSINTGIHDNNIVYTYFTISVSSIDQLRNIISSIKKIKHVQSVKRLDKLD